MEEEPDVALQTRTGSEEASEIIMRAPVPIYKQHNTAEVESSPACAAAVGGHEVFRSD